MASKKILRRLAPRLLHLTVAGGGPLALYGAAAWVLHDGLHFSPEWACLLGGAVAIVTHRVWEAPGEQAAPWKRLRRLALAARAVSDRHRLETMVVSSLFKLYRPAHVALWLPTLGEAGFSLAASVGRCPAADVLPEFVMRLVREREAGAWLVSRVAEPQDAFEQLMQQIGARVVLPLVAHDHLVGVITVGARPQGRAYAPMDCQGLAEFGLGVAEAIWPHQLKAEQELHRSKFEAVSRMYLDAQKRAATDGLTGLASHPHFKEQLNKRFTEARRFNQPLSLMFLDADHFKLVNDTYGHLTGDEVLKALAEAAQLGARACDTVARYGGEELAMLLPQTDLAGAAILAERIRQAISELDIPEVGGRRRVRVTASIGVAQLTEDDLAPADLLDRADQALYVAKRSGRNQVIQSV